MADAALGLAIPLPPLAPRLHLRLVELGKQCFLQCDVVRTRPRRPTLPRLEASSAVECMVVAQRRLVLLQARPAAHHSLGGDGLAEEVHQLVGDGDFTRSTSRLSHNRSYFRLAVR